MFFKKISRQENRARYTWPRLLVKILQKDAYPFKTSWLCSWMICLKTNPTCSSKTLFSPNYKVLIVYRKIKMNPWYCLTFGPQASFCQSQKFCLQLLGSQRSGTHLVVMSLNIIVFVHGVCMCNERSHERVYLCVICVCACKSMSVGVCRGQRGDVEHPALSRSTMSSWDGVFSLNLELPFFFWLGQLAIRPQWSSSRLFPVLASCSHRWLKCGLNSDLTLAWKGPLTQWHSPEPSQSWTCHRHL